MITVGIREMKPLRRNEVTRLLPEAAGSVTGAVLPFAMSLTLVMYVFPSVFWVTAMQTG